jgi:hypothetical protein
MEITPNIGLGQLRFGMRPSEVQAVLGSHQTYEPWMGENVNDSLLYPGLIIGFDKCDSSGPLKDSKLVEFRINEKADVTFLKKPFFGMLENELVQTLAQHDIRSEKKLSNYFLPDLHMELDLDERGRVTWVVFWGQSLISSRGETALQRFRLLSNDDLEDVRAVVGWKFWIGPIMLTFFYVAAVVVFSLNYGLWAESFSDYLLMQLIFFAALGIPTMFLWFTRLKQYKQFDRDRHLGIVEIVEGRPEQVWMNADGLCYIRFAGHNILLEYFTYIELRTATLVRVEFLLQSCIAVRASSIPGPIGLCRRW